MPESDNLPTKPEPIKYNLQTRPPKYTDPKEMARKIEQYFVACDTGKKVAVIRKGKEVMIHKPRP